MHCRLGDYKKTTQKNNVTGMKVLLRHNRGEVSRSDRAKSSGRDGMMIIGREVSLTARICKTIEKLDWLTALFTGIVR